MRSKFTSVVGTSVILHGLMATAFAVPVVISGNDNGSGLGARPLSDAAAAAFNAAVPSSNLITFESAAVGNFTSLVVAPGVTVTLTNFSTDTSITGISADNTDAGVGFNTTVGGTKSVRIVPLYTAASAQLTFAFTTPINAFGFYLTGTETMVNGTFTLNFNDGTSQTLPIVENTLAGTQFFGFTDVGTSISSVTLTDTGPFVTRDIVGVDDVRYRSIPEPAGVAALAGVALLAARRRR